MATYYHGNSEIQPSGGADGLQTLVLMNPAGYIHYSEQAAPPQQQQQPAGNLVFLNSTTAAAANNNSFSPHAPPSSHTQQFVGIPLTSQDLNNQQQQHPISVDVPNLHGFLPRMQYNSWNTIEHNSAARDTPRSQQGLSLSLSSQQAARFGSNMSGGSPSPASVVTNNNGNSGIQSVLLSSKYLKAAHEILEEVVNVNRSTTELLGKKTTTTTGGNGNNKVLIGGGGDQSSSAVPMGSGGDAAAGSIIGISGKRGGVSGTNSDQLSTPERQEIQMKKAKLINMLDEVEQRYRQYHHQMEVVVSSFEQAAGIGSARAYTALALETISKQFRCLKDAIAGQIRSANNSLGEEDHCLVGNKIEAAGSRLKYVDHQLRQQRALQHLGMIQHNAWRPQRGLPERSVSVLRAWLFEHFLHPYPKDSDKHMLAKQTGLTRSQVSNWFINARVRLWKPMVEEMYMEEMKEHELNGSEDKSSKSNDESSSLKFGTSTDQEKGPNSKAAAESKTHNTLVGGNNNIVRNQSGFSFMGSSELEGIAQGSPKKPRNHDIMHTTPNNVPSINMDVIKTNEENNNNEKHNRDGYSFMGNQTNFMQGGGGFGQYPIGDIGRFDSEQFAPRFSSNAVSLTLGLDSIQGNHHQPFLPNQNIQLGVGRSIDISEPNEFGAINTSPPHSTAAAYETINMQNPKRFAAQLLPDFVT